MEDLKKMYESEFFLSNLALGNHIVRYISVADIINY